MDDDNLDWDSSELDSFLSDEEVALFALFPDGFDQDLLDKWVALFKEDAEIQ